MEISLSIGNEVVFIDEDTKQQIGHITDLFVKDGRSMCIIDGYDCLRHIRRVDYVVKIIRS